jgi:plastocyanin
LIRRAAVGCALAAALAGCGTGSDLTTSSTRTSQAASNGPVRIVMQSLSFNPTAVKATVGQTVTWTNDDQAPHNVTYISGPAFRSSRQRLMIGQHFSIQLRQAGTIHYVCTLHPWMKAEIVVSP